MKLVIPTLGLIASCVVGCSSTPVPTARVASTESAVQSARTAGAERTPQARTHLANADQELGKAKNLIKDGDNAEATAMLTRAESDATLAAALSDAAQQEAARDAALRRVRAIWSASSTGAPPSPAR